MISPEKKTLLVTAHPDDECMFFAPLIQSFGENTTELFHLLCLSNGNFDGIGKIREKELYWSCNVLGLDSKNVKCLDHEKMQDGMDETWDKDIISEEINAYVEQHDIMQIISFDEKGISGHPNHKSCYEGVREYLWKNNASKRHTSKSICGFRLLTTNIVRKYMGILDYPLTAAVSQFSIMSNCNQFWKGILSMKQHRSQLAWFRYLYIWFSRYMFINSFETIEF